MDAEESNTYHFSLLWQPTAEELRKGEEAKSQLLMAKLNCNTNVIYGIKGLSFDQLLAQGTLIDTINLQDKSEQLGDDPKGLILIKAICGR